MLGAEGPDEKSEVLRAIREPVIVPVLLDQCRRALKRNFFEIENKEGHKYCNSNFARFAQLAL